MSVDRAFKPKQLDTGPKLEAERTELLRDLGTDYKEVEGFTTALNFVTSPPQFFSELVETGKVEALFNPEYSNSGNLKFRGDLIQFRGDYIPRSTVESTGFPNVPPDSRDLILDIVNARTEAVAESTRLRAEVEGFTTALNFVTSPPQFFSELVETGKVEALFNPEYSNSGNLKFRGDLIQFRGDYIPRSTVESTGFPDLSGKNQKLLKDFIFLGEKVPDEVKENLIRLVSAQDSKARERMLQSMARMGDLGLEKDLIDWVKTFETEVRRSQFKAEFYSALEKGETFEELEARISGYENENETDTALNFQLREVASARRRERIISGSARVLNESKDYERVFDSLATLGKSGSEADKEAANVVAKQAAALETAEYKERILGLITNEVDPGILRAETESLPIRASIGGVDYVQTVVEVREQAAPLVAEILRIRRLDKANKIRESFGRQSDVDTVLSSIEAFPGETAEDLEIKNTLFDLYKTYVAASRPEVYDERFSGEMAVRIREQLEARFAQPELGKNREAFNYLRSRFLNSVYPLIESLRADPSKQKAISQFLDTRGANGGTVRPRLQFQQRLSTLESQRPLTDVERNYLESVELLSLFNPYLVAVACVEPGVTSEFLRHHFDRISEQTLLDLRDGDYVPAIQFGLGPNGMAALGETVRNNPQLAASMLVVDQGAQPGGPFAIPGGAAWELNSANKRGNAGPSLPERPREDAELKTVRAYGSPLRWYPGERVTGADIRQGSINSTVDYLPTPDDLSYARYPTNEELEIILSLQAAMLVDRLALNTRIQSVEPNTNQDEKGDKIVTLEIRSPMGIKTLRLKTDAVFGASGLGEQSYGFTIEGSKARRVLEETEGAEGFPKISRTLEAFGALSDRTKESVSPGETLVIYGKGNSADTLIEFIGSIFQGNNPRVREVKKIYLVSEGGLSSRPRYASIADIKPRNGKGNLVEFINGRVEDVDFATNETDPSLRKLSVLDRQGNQITDANGRPIIADSVISAAGFRPQLDAIFEAYSEKRDPNAQRGVLERDPLVLPTNLSVPVAETLRQDSNVIFLGTASRPYFEGSSDKLNQLPREAREALLRNGAENAVAIGFRAPDTQAAMNIWLNSRVIQVEAPIKQPRPVVPLAGDVAPGTRMVINRTVQDEEVRVPNNVTDETMFLSPLLAYTVGMGIEVSSGESQKGYTGQLNFALTLDEQGDLMLEYQGGPKASISQELIDTVTNACEDRDFQNYARNILRKKRRNPTLDLAIGFKAGKLDPSQTFVQD